MSVSEHGYPLNATSGYRLQDVNVTQVGINLTFTKAAEAAKPQPAWSWRLEHRVPVTAPSTDEINTSIVFGSIYTFVIWNFPNAISPSPWCVNPQTDVEEGNNVLCVATETEAHSLLDALATLVVATGGNLDTPEGLYLEMMSEEGMRPHPEKAFAHVRFMSVDGPPADAGIKVLDIIQTVNNKPCTDGKTFRAAIDEAAAKPLGGVVHVGIRRKLRRLEFDLRYPHADDKKEQLQMGNLPKLRKQATPKL